MKSPFHFQPIPTVIPEQLNKVEPVPGPSAIKTTTETLEPVHKPDLKKPAASIETIQVFCRFYVTM